MACYHPLRGYRSRHVGETGSRPIVFSRSEGYSDLPVDLPCGQCIGCRLERSRQWAVRCHHEASLHARNSFVTLTFDDEHLPASRSVDVRDLQLFMKRLRKRFGAGIRFYGCGEYGDALGRPHYHVCLFNFRPDDLVLFREKDGNRLYKSQVLDDIWGQGFTITGDVTFQSAAYVARYIMKKINGDRSTSHYETVDPITGEIFSVKPEFTSMSRRPGIGKGWLDKYKGDVYNYDYVIINGKKVRPPKYYDKLYQADCARDYLRLHRQRVNNARRHNDNNTPDRLVVREEVQIAKFRKLPRKLEEGEEDDL